VLNTENSEAVKTALAANPKIQALYTAVEKDEKIAKYLANRKVSRVNRHRLLFENQL
jgi:hypothetical protein